MLPLPVQFLIALVVSAFNERMARRFEYLHEEHRVLRKVFSEFTGRRGLKYDIARSTVASILEEAGPRGPQRDPA